MIDFTQIRSILGGQKEAFEELVCQLAYREVLPNATFRRIEGSGGDGGIEAYWLLADGTKIGYQAKFFIRATEIKWKQITESVEQAIKTHPTLTKYIVALPCNLTDRRGTKGKGGTGWELWERNRAKWQEICLAASGHTLEFIPWTAFDLSNKMAAQPAEGLRRYWFNKIEFSEDWFRDHVNLAATSLEERYHPDDHVDVSLQKLFHFISRDELAIKELRDHFLSVRREIFKYQDDYTQTLEISAEIYNDLASKINGWLEIERELAPSLSETWKATSWVTLSTDLKDTIETIRMLASDKRSSLTLEKENEKALRIADGLIDKLYKFRIALQSFIRLISSPYIEAEQTRVALIDGRAGSGKSHLLAHAAEVALKSGQYSILLLGQQFNNAPIWEQITKRLGLGEISSDVFLQAFDTACEANRKRGLIIVDALNEGAGAQLWKPNLMEFLAKVNLYRNLVCIVSCRTEYVPYTVPETVLSKFKQFSVQGFESVEEQIHAAKVYLGKRGISIPSTPWLAPEFINPLFLRSTCIALQREKKTEFPRGLIGTKSIFKFYLTSVSRNLGAGRDGSDDLIAGTVGALRNIARQMAEDRSDFISQAQATRIADSSFAHYSPGAGQSWLDVLIRNGLLRRDPNPIPSEVDPLSFPLDVVRFSFQRFQDHLVTEVLLEGISDIEAAFHQSGALAFLQIGDSFEWRWHGIIGALSMQIPERFGRELVDVIPGDKSRALWSVYDAFYESLRWRDKNAFTVRTLELFNSTLADQARRFSLLIELSASVDHPWNAKFLHKNLLARKMPQRDAFWTVYVNASDDDASEPTGRVIDWCLFGQSGDVDKTAQLLCGMTLCWLFTSSNRKIRDRATKALTSLLLSSPDILGDLLVYFKDVDDIYVLERLFGAAYGACCLDPSRSRVTSYACSTYLAVFKNCRPPLSILLRDYGRGIIELCHAKWGLPRSIDFAKCHPPYKSNLPRLTISQAALDNIAKKCGDTDIAYSCNGLGGDFGRYEIEPRLRSFLVTPLSRARPIFRSEIEEKFLAEVINSDERKKAFDNLRNARSSTFFNALLDDDKEPTEDDARKWIAAFSSAKEKLFNLLTREECIRYEKEAPSYLIIGRTKTFADPNRTDIDRAKRWVAFKAYKLGWTKKLFPYDLSQGGRSRDRPSVERIGKKYQWIALDELLCRLADNNWLGVSYPDTTKVYDNPLDIGFERDIDPTIIPVDGGRRLSDHGKRDSWVTAPDIVIEKAQDAYLASWPFLRDPGRQVSSLIRKQDWRGKVWITLYEHRSKTERYENKNERFFDSKQQEFRFLYCIFIEESDQRMLEYVLSKNMDQEVHDWQPSDYTDGPYLGEAPWRRTWTTSKWKKLMQWKAPPGISIASPVVRYRWESHLDASMPEGAEALIPSPWLSDSLSLHPDPNDASTYHDSNSEVAFIGSAIDDDGSSAIMEENILNEFLKKEKLACIWLLSGERLAWPSHNIDNAAWRHFRAIAWLENGEVKSKNWKYDGGNGTSKGSVPSSKRPKA